MKYYTILFLELLPTLVEKLAEGVRAVHGEALQTAEDVRVAGPVLRPAESET